MEVNLLGEPYLNSTYIVPLNKYLKKTYLVELIFT